MGRQTIRNVTGQEETVMTTALELEPGLLPSLREHHDKITSGKLIEIYGSTAELRLTENDQTDPAGRYREWISGDTWYWQRAASAEWATTTTLMELSSTGRLAVTETTDSTSVQVLELSGDRATPADTDNIYLSFKMSDDAGNQDEMARLAVVMDDVSSGTEDAHASLHLRDAGTLTEYLRVDPSGSRLILQARQSLQIAVGFQTAGTLRLGGNATPAGSVTGLYIDPADDTDPTVWIAQLSTSDDIAEVLRLGHTDSGGALAGKGAGLTFYAQPSTSTGGTNRFQARIHSAWLQVSGNPTSTSRSKLVFSVDTDSGAAPDEVASVVGAATGAAYGSLTTGLAIGSGEGAKTTPTGYTLRAPDVITGGAGNVAGADLTISAGVGTGTGDEGTIILALPVQAAAGDNIQTSAARLTLDMAGGSNLYLVSAGTGANGMVLKDLKNAAASALSGTQRDIEINIGGVPYYATVYPTKA